MGARRSFRNSIRLFCRGARQSMRWRLARGNASRSVVSFVACPVSGLILETEFNRVGRGSAGTIISSQLLCRAGTRGLRLSRPHLEFWGKSVYVNRDGNAFSPCAVGPEEASLAAANPVHRLLGHRDGGPGPPSHD